MHKRSQAFLTAQRDALMPLILDAGKSCEDLMLALKAAGPKKTWSAHQKMEFQASYIPITEKANAFSAAIVALLPAHWNMSQYRVRVTLDAKAMRFCDKMGKANGGIGTNTTVGDFAFIAGYIAGAISASKESHPEHTKRMRALNIPIDGNKTFGFHCKRSNGYVQIHQGRTPRDAFAQAHATGGLFNRGDWTNLLSPEQAFDFGAARARKLILGEMPGWTLMPTLWETLTKNKIVRGLYRDSLSYNDWDPFWKKELQIDKLEKLCANAIALLPLIKKKPTKTTWMVVTGNSTFTPVEAWCPASAILWLFIQKRSDKYLPYQLASWTVFPSTSECGTAARAAMSIPVKHPCDEDPEKQRRQHPFEKEYDDLPF